MSKGKPFVKVLPPKSYTASAAEIQKIIAMGWIEIPPEKKFNGNAALMILLSFYKYIY